MAKVKAKRKTPFFSTRREKLTTLRLLERAYWECILFVDCPEGVTAVSALSALAKRIAAPTPYSAPAK